MGDTKELEEIYKKAGLDVCSVCCKTGEGVEKVKEMIKGGITVFTGNTGVGKSSLLNCIDSRFSIETGEVSSKLGRGRHTTRDVTLHKVNDFYVADTPGFSSLDIESGELIMKDDLPYCFPEFSEYLGKCRFSSCTHTVDKGCKILDALEKGDIHESRHLSYVTMFNEVKNIKEWQL